MSMADLIPTLDDAALASLAANCERLQTSGTDRQQTEAATLLPLIAAERADRLAKAPPKAPRKTPVRKKAVAKKPVMDEDERALAE
jgi:hypothetical protein